MTAMSRQLNKIKCVLRSQLISPHTKRVRGYMLEIMGQLMFRGNRTMFRGARGEYYAGLLNMVFHL